MEYHIGMKVVPVSKTRYSSWDEWKNDAPYNWKFFLRNGFLYLKDIYDSGEVNLSEGVDGYGSTFHISDIRPWIQEQTKIEVED